MPRRETGPRLSEWPPTVEYLAATIDRLGEVINAVLVSGGHKPRKIRPVPRPVTAATRVTNRRRQSKHDRVRTRVEEARARAAIGKG